MYFFYMDVMHAGKFQCNAIIDEYFNYKINSI